MTAPEPRQPASPATRRRRLPGRRLWAVALVTFRQGMRMRLWILAPLAVVILVLADLSSQRFDPVFEAVPAAVGTSVLVMAVLAVVLGIFFATYSIPAEMESKVAFSVVTKPVSRGEIVAGKTVGMALLMAALLLMVAAGAYVYITVRAGGIQSLAAERLEEARPRAVHPADLNALEVAARRGPLLTYRYQDADSGPDVAIHYAAEAPTGPEVRWILGRTGMRLRWTLPGSPLREWLASGPGRLRLALDARRPAARPDEPLKLLVMADAAGAEAQPRREGPPPTRMVEITIPAEGPVEVPVTSPDSPPIRDILNLPAAGDVTLDVMLDNLGALVGARAASLVLVGPGGQESPVAAAPEANVARQFGRAMLVGMPDLPREVAVFRFADVPASVLAPGDVAVELGFTLDAWKPATIQSAALATFVNPRTGAEKTFQFTPEGNHATLLYLDPEFWHGGPIEARLECLTADDYMGLLPGSVRLRLDGGPFALHLAAATARVWLFGTVLAAVGVFVSARLSWYVSILAMCPLLIFGIAREAVSQFPLMQYVQARVVAAAQEAVPWSGWDDLVRHVIIPFPDLGGLLPPDSVNLGQAMSGADLASACGWAALGVAVFVAAGALLLRHREVAA
ncbi:MAG: ABC transporter permease subunit [Planctomycetes bacterium]|nr:ABC transporter permease subunit [Planctomycetota bacterium]